MKHLPTIAGALLGLLFIVFSAMVLFNPAAVPKPPEDGSLMSHFMLAFAGSGYLVVVKSLEMLGGILVAIPKTRAWGLLVLGPIIVNILLFHLLITGPATVLDPILLTIVALALYLLWTERRGFLGLLH